MTDLKPKPINRDGYIEQQDLNPKKFKVGPIESDSGNHLIDVAAVFIGLLALLYFKKILKGK